MTNMATVTDYAVYMSASSNGFNEWRRNIFMHTDQPEVTIDLRFVEGDPKAIPYEQVREHGVSQLYLSVNDFTEILALLQSEQPIYVVLYEDVNWALLQTGPEPPGDQEPKV